METEEYAGTVRGTPVSVSNGMVTVRVRTGEMVKCHHNENGGWLSHYCESLRCKKGFNEVRWLRRRSNTYQVPRNALSKWKTIQIESMLIMIVVLLERKISDRRKSTKTS